MRVPHPLWLCVLAQCPPFQAASNMISRANELALQPWRRPRIEAPWAWCGAVFGVHAHALEAASALGTAPCKHAAELALQPWRRPRIEAPWAWCGAVVGVRGHAVEAAPWRRPM